MSRPPVVVKFGGAALANVDEVAAHVRSLRAGGRRLIVVVSARAGVTDRLVAAVRDPTDAGAHARTVAILRRGHPNGGAALDRRFGELARAFAWSERRDRLDAAAVDRILAFGERLSVDWVVPELRRAADPRGRLRHVRARAVDRRSARSRDDPPRPLPSAGPGAAPRVAPPGGRPGRHGVLSGGGPTALP